MSTIRDTNGTKHIGIRFLYGLAFYHGFIIVLSCFTVLSLRGIWSFIIFHISSFSTFGCIHDTRRFVCFHEACHIPQLSPHYPHTRRGHVAKKICLRGEHANALINILYFVVIEFYRIDITLLLTIYHINITAHPYFTTIMKR